MNQGLKSDSENIDFIVDTTTDGRHETPIGPSGEGFRWGRDDVMQVAESMRKSVETAADLLLRTAVEETRARFLAEASRRLLASTDEESTFSTLARLFVPMLADGACVLTVCDGNVHCRAVAHADGDKERFVLILAQNLALHAERQATWTAQVFQQGRGQELSGQSLAEIFGPDSNPGDTTEAIQMLDVRWLEGWPLVSQQRVLGGIYLFGSALRHEFDVAGGEMLQSLAQSASLAVDNARIHQDARQSIRARERLMAFAAHDLRNSLSLALMSLSLLDGASEGLNASAAASRLATLRKGLSRMQRLVDDLLDFSSLEAGRLSMTTDQQSVRRLVEDTLEAFRDPAAQTGVCLSGRVPGETCVVEGDAFRLLQVLSNLVGNALKFTPTGGNVTIAAVEGDSNVEFSVMDTGCGIAPTELPHVFEAYQRSTRTRSGGVGLGLSIAKGIVESHGGMMWVQSRLGEGTTFYFTVPKMSLARTQIASV